MVSPSGCADMEEVAVTKRATRELPVGPPARSAEPTSIAACTDHSPIRCPERSSLMKNRMREICTSGSVRGGDGNVPTYSAERKAHRVVSAVSGQPLEPGISVDLEDALEPGQVSGGTGAPTFAGASSCDPRNTHRLPPGEWVRTKDDRRLHSTKDCLSLIRSDGRCWWCEPLVLSVVVRRP